MKHPTTPVQMVEPTTLKEAKEQNEILRQQLAEFQAVSLNLRQQMNARPPKGPGLTYRSAKAICKALAKDNPDRGMEASEREGHWVVTDQAERDEAGKGFRIDEPWQWLELKISNANQNAIAASQAAQQALVFAQATALRVGAAKQVEVGEDGKPVEEGNGEPPKLPRVFAPDGRALIVQ